MKKKRVLHILNTGSYSGAENVVISIINNTKEEVDSVYLSKDGTIREILKENDIDFYPVTKISFKELRRAVKEIKPDVIHAHDFTAGIMSAMTIFNVPIINHLHNNSPWLQKIGLKSILYAVSTFRYKKILTVSDSVMDEFIFSNICKAKSEVIGNPIDIKKIVEKVENKNICEPYEIAFLGRLSPPKNPLFFLEIISELKKRMPNIQVRMIGDGELREEVESKIKELELEDNVKLLGFQRNPYEYLYQAKILCMPSVWEGFGLAAVEAIALGKPVVAAPVGGLVNIVDESCGKLCCEKMEYVNEITKLLTNVRYYKKKCEGAIVKVGVVNNITKYTQNIIDLYNQI